MTFSGETEVVYVLTNPAMPGIVKIGVTSQKDVGERLKQLYTTGVPLPFECFYACKVPKDKQVEDKLHFAFDASRINPSREFFKIEPERVQAILELVKIDEVTRELENELEEGVSDQEKAASETYKKKRPPMNFREMGIPPGSVLHFKRSDVSVTVHDDRKILYGKDVTSLTAATQHLLGVDRAVQPAPHWTYNGRVLRDIYNETYPFTDTES
jgi:hypothetical protein